MNNGGAADVLLKGLIQPKKKIQSFTHHASFLTELIFLILWNAHNFFHIIMQIKYQKSSKSLATTSQIAFVYLYSHLSARGQITLHQLH